MRTHYEAPAIRELGSLAELTQAPFNKTGKSTDIYTQLTSGAVVGSLVPVA